MGGWDWRSGAAGASTIGGKRLETLCHGPAPDRAPTIVMLHEGLGCVALWRDFPRRLAAATGFGVFAYSRAGYGQSDPVALPRPLDYMTREARETLPELLDAIGFRRGVLLGHSDGASIAAIYAGSVEDFRVRGLVLMAPHFFTEPSGLAAIAAARDGLRKRRSAERGSPNTTATSTCAFRGWSDAWLDPGFQGLEHRRLHRLLARAGARDPGRRRPIRHAGANPRDRGARLLAGRRRDACRLSNMRRISNSRKRPSTAIADFCARLERIEASAVEVTMNQGGMPQPIRLPRSNHHDYE